jgi:hypothetical protein
VDQFYAKISQTVVKGVDTNIPVTLRRIVGKVEFVLEDVSSSKAHYISLTSADLPGIRYYFTQTDDYIPSLAETSPFVEIAYPSASPGLTVSFYCYENINDLQDRYPVSFLLEAKSEEGTVLESKEINDVEIVKNQLVRYTGKMFPDDTPPSDPSGSSFTVTVNNIWDEIIDTPF